MGSVEGDRTLSLLYGHNVQGRVVELHCWCMGSVEGDITVSLVYR